MRANSSAFTLVEITIVTLLLAIIAAALTFSHRAADARFELDAAASEVASAIRFARSEAMRTGIPHGARVEWFTQRVRVYRLDTSGLPTPVYDVRNPVDKHLYEMDFDTHALLSEVSISYVDIRYVGSLLPSEYVGFSASGTPKSNSGGLDQMLDRAKITLAHSGRQRRVEVQPMTGRVTIQ